LGELKGTHTEPAWGMPATGVPVNADIYRFDSGKVAEAWHVVDRFRAMQQLGVLPGADGADPPAIAVEAGPDASGDSTSTEAMKAVARRAIEDVSGKGATAALDDVYSLEYVFHDPDTTESVGLEGVKERMALIHSISSTALIQVEDMVAEGDLVAARWSVTGTDNGSGLMGAPPTGKDFWGDIVSFYRIADGRIVEGWMVADPLAMMEQLGLIPGAGETGE
jgi:predicted ester cyclase